MQTITISPHDKAILRDLAKHVKEIAESPLMQERIKAWTNHNDLKPSRPMILLELMGLGPERELLYQAFPKAGAFVKRQCEGDYSYELEKQLKKKCIEHMTIGDDTVVDGFFNISWIVDSGNYGVEINRNRGVDSTGRDLAYLAVPPIPDMTKAPDILKLGVFSCDKQTSLQNKAIALDIFGDILEVRMRTLHWWTMGLTWSLIDLIGMENMLVGMIEEPETIHFIMNFLCEEHIRYAQFLEQEGMYSPNTGNDYVGSGSKGYTTDLPNDGRRPDGGAYLRDTWVLIESQETVSVSTDMFCEFVLPYHKKIAEMFGLVYYGCCEPLDKRIDAVKSIPNLRSLSISPWSDEEAMAKECGRSYVYSRKPAPSQLSGPVADYDAIGRDIENTLKVAGGCNLEIVMKDLHTTSKDIMRIKKWVDMARSLAGSVGK